MDALQTELALAPAFAPEERARSVWRSLLRRPRLVVGVLLIFLTLLAALGGPLVMPYDPHQPNVRIRLQGPTAEHVMGTDRTGRDQFSRILSAIGISMQVAAGAVALAVVTGVPIGAASGFLGGRFDSAIMRVMDAIIAFPARLLAIALVASAGASILSLWFAIGFPSMPRFARLTRAGVLSQKGREYVEGAYAIGESPVSVLVRYILPNAIAPVLVQITLTFALAILVEASLSFLGLGLQAPTISLGQMLQEAQVHMETAPWLAIFPGLVLSLIVLGFTLVGDALRDHFDPRQH